MKTAKNIPTYLLFSSGRESVIGLYKSIENGETPTLVHVDYGQPNSDMEVSGLNYYANKFGVPALLLSLPLRLPTDFNGDVNVHAVPHMVDKNHVVLRNTLLILYVINNVYQFSPLKLLIGTPKEFKKFSLTYTDGGHNFLQDIAIFVTSQYPDILITSYVKQIKNDNVLRYAIRKKYDLSHVWWCDKKPSAHTHKMCGECYKCRLVKESSKLTKNEERRFFSR